MDREKVIKAVEEAFDLVHSDFIGTDDFNETEWEQNKADAIALLKEQEAVEPEWFDGTPFCGNCGHRLEKKSRNTEIKCPTCERAVKWLKTPTAGDNHIPLRW